MQGLEPVISSGDTESLLLEAAKKIFIFGGLPLFGFAVAVFLLIQFPQVKLVLSTLFGALGAAGKWFRRKSLETDLEGRLNSFTRAFNRNYTFGFLPECD